MSSSNSLEVFFSVDPGRTILREPLFFHHTPKTAGTSFRYAVRHFLTEQRAGNMVIPAVRAGLKNTHSWPDGLARLYRLVADNARVEAVMSHYTALLADHVDLPILSIIRDPDEHYPSYLAFHMAHAETLIRATKSVDIILRWRKFTNPQIRSFWTPDIRIPADPPESDAAMRPWLDLVDRTIERFTLFRMADYAALLRHCQQRFGTHLIEVREKRGRRDAALDRLMGELAPLLNDRDPLWLDRVLYDRLERAVPARAGVEAETAGDRSTATA